MALVGEGVRGYVTPKVTVAAIVGNERGEILLTQRADSGVWLYPVGYADVGYSPSEIAVKEVYEETGIEVEPVSLVPRCSTVYGSGSCRCALYSLLFHCRMLGGELRGHPLERAGRLLPPRQRSVAARRRAALGRARVRSHRRRAAPASFEPPRTPPWRS